MYGDVNLSLYTLFINYEGLGLIILVEYLF